MAKFLFGTQLYEAMQQKSKQAKQSLWICSPRLGYGAHEVLSQETLKTLPPDTRFLFPINDAAVKAGEINPYEAEFLQMHYPNSCMRTLDGFGLNIYVFDDLALVTSAVFAKSAFERFMEAGVLLDGAEAEGLKNFFCSCLWENAKPVKDLRRLKKLWNHTTKSIPVIKLVKAKAPPKIENWTDEAFGSWYFLLLDSTVKKVARKIQKEANWPKTFSLATDIGPNAFRKLKPGDNAFLADLSKNRSEVPVHFARIFDKSRAETDVGDLHFAYEPKKTYLIERSSLYEILKKVGIHAKSSEIQLTQEQAKLLTSSFESIKPKKKPRKRTKK